MRSLPHIIIASLFSIALTGIAAANEPIQPLPRPTFAAGVVAPGIGGYRHLRTGGAASTAHESILRGRADVIRAHGEYKLLTAEALRSYEEARSRRIDNDVKELASRQERRRMWTAEQHARHAEARARREMGQSLTRAYRETQMDTVSTTVHPEAHAQSKLRLAKNLLIAGRYESGINRLVDITRTYGHTAAAQEAVEILHEIQS